ncbi:hypothetical protein BJX70DRAFT_357010 [Aspergillus crustosus]
MGIKRLELDLLDVFKSVYGYDIDSWAIPTETVAGIFAILFWNAAQNRLRASPMHVAKRGAPSITPSKFINPKPNPALKTIYKVLLAVHIRDSQPNLNAWSSWITRNMPRGLLSADVKIESLFQTSSTVCLLTVTVPFEIWTMLDPTDEAISFVIHVTSSDFPTKPRQNAPLALPIHPGAGPQSLERSSQGDPKSLR